jgi:hypothetical protein
LGKDALLSIHVLARSRQAGGQRPVCVPGLSFTKHSLTRLRAGCRDRAYAERLIGTQEFVCAENLESAVLVIKTAKNRS